MMSKAKRPPALSIRLTPEDQKLLAELKKTMGVVSACDVFRQGLRALAAKQGVTA